MKKRYKVMFLIYFILVVYALFMNPNTMMSVNALDYVACGSATGIPKPIPQATTIAYTLLMAGTPIVLVVTSIMTLIKASSRNDSDEILKAKNKLLKKFLIAAVVFLTSVIVQFVITRVTSTKEDKSTLATCIKCFISYNDTDCVLSKTGNDVEEGTYTDPYSNIEQAPSSRGGAALSKSYVKSKGKFFWPLPEPYGDNVIRTSRYGCRFHPIYHVCRKHSGTDLGVPQGTEIYAAADGTATVYNQGSVGCGLFILIEHDDGYKTKYCHMSKTAIQGTTKVKMGQVIGYVGSTGDSTGPHLHFEVIKNGASVNAMEYYQLSESKMAPMSDSNCPRGC